MSANECELLLSKIIDIIIRYENQIEDVRIQLARNQYFFPSPSFKRIAIDGKGYLREEDLEGFLRHYGLSVNDKELRRFFISDKEKSTVMSYNSFLDQVLPSTDLELKTKCLERKNKDLETVSQVLLADVDRLITSIYQKEIELFRALKGNINRFIEFDIELIEFVFSMLSDDNSGYLTFKSLLSFMKKNGYTFDKRGYESLMKRVDKKAKAESIMLN
jgi:Ca2+-binding EF-hand superfamily protein